MKKYHLDEIIRRLIGKEAGFILDRGYFSKENIHFMDKNGYEIFIMMKGMKSLAHDLVLSVKGSFEEKHRMTPRIKPGSHRELIFQEVHNMDNK